MMFLSAYFVDFKCWKSRALVITILRLTIRPGLARTFKDFSQCPRFLDLETRRAGKFTVNV